MRHLLLALILTIPLAADPLADVRASLGRLTAREPIRATYEVQRTVASEGRFENEKYTGKATVELEGDASGFRVVIPRVLLDQLEREQHARSRDPKQSTPTVSALGEAGPVKTSDAIDFAPVLVRMLEGAKVVADQNGTWQGKPARIVIFRLADKVDEDDAGKVKFAENRLTLWLGSDLVPVAAEHIVNAKFSFLFLKGESKQKISWHFAHVADRLVRVHLEDSQISSGMGQKGNEKLVATVRVH